MVIPNFMQAWFTGAVSNMNKINNVSIRGLWGNLLVSVVLLLSFNCLASAAESVGAVLISKGVVSVVSAANETRIIAKGGQLFEGDRLITAEDSFVVVKLNDATKITLRPETDFLITSFSEEPGSEEAVFELLKGGLRAITGATGTNNPEAFQINSPVASIGIRGTDLVLRLCEQDCAEEEKKYVDREYVQTTCPEELDFTIPPGLYFAVFDGSIYADQPPRHVDLDAVSAGYGTQDTLKCVSPIPKFIINDPYLKLNTVGEEMLELINFFNRDVPDLSKCEVPED